MILWEFSRALHGISAALCVRARVRVRALINATDMIDKFRNHR